jgi:pepF/M3 family oligoendopeptidase
VPSTPTAALPHWQLESIYPSLDSREFADDKRRLADEVAALERFFDDHDVRGGAPTDSANHPAHATTLEGAIQRLERCASLLATIQPFVNLRVATDAFDERSQAEVSALRPLSSRVTALMARFKAWVGGLDLGPLSARSTIVAEHQYQLERHQREASHLLADESEELVAYLDETGGSAWSKLYNQLIARETISADVEGDDAGQREYGVAALRALQAEPDEGTRRRAFQAELQLLRRNAVPYAAALNGIKGQVGMVARRRGWDGALEHSLFQHGISRASLEAMQAACSARFDDLRGYLRAKARLLGTEKLRWYDLYAPLPQAEASSYTWEEAKAFVVERFGSYSEYMASFAQRTFDQGWIDVPPRTGKRNGAFCSPIHPRGESRVMLNFTGTLGDIRTLAHELGHAYHNDCKVRFGRDVLQVPTPMTLSETASIFCETIVFQGQLQASSGPNRMALLEQDLQQVTQLVLDIHSRFLFEAGVFERRRTRDLSVEELDGLMLAAQDSTYGDTLDPSARHPLMWAHKGHYYSSGLSFYNYPYTFGFLFGLGLYAQYQQGSAGFAERYDELLASTGMADAASLARGFAIDIEDQAFWRGSLDVIAQRVAAFQEAAGQLPRAS